MGLSIFDLFKIGVGPSSSHTVGPMVAANRFINHLLESNLLKQTKKVNIDLYGSLAMTGAGHATDIAVLLGLLGENPKDVDPDQIPHLIEKIKKTGQLSLAGIHDILFTEEENLQFRFGHSLPAHPNGMKIEALDHNEKILYRNNYYSVGGGFVLDEEEVKQNDKNKNTGAVSVPYPFESCKELIERCQENNFTIAQLVLNNEYHLARYDNIEKEVLVIWQAMKQCIDRGCQQQGVLPGGLNVSRRAYDLHQSLLSQGEIDPLHVMDWVNLYALAVNEENAVGGRVVTAPTNGAAGVIPAVLNYYVSFIKDSDDKGIIDFLATASAIGMLYKKNASISAAEVGCQGEIGVACSMAAGALCAVLGGSLQQIENAAEIGMEHNLGLTCDPIGGLVQIPCIERNTMGSIKAINAARLALNGTGNHRITLDEVIETMRQTGLDMQEKYKETSTGGLAVNVVMC